MRQFAPLGFFLSGIITANAAEVMTWIPPYSIPQIQKLVADQPAILPSFTRIGLQLWNPDSTGRGVVLAPTSSEGIPVDTAKVRELVAMGHLHGIKMLLTIYNNSEVLRKWTWPLARNTFVDSNRTPFIEAILAEMRTYDLDGIDIDYEGIGNSLYKDRPAFKLFIHQLSDSLKQQGKLLTVNTFHTPCFNAPNMSWWQDWVGKVDNIHTMGYSSLYEGSTEKIGNCLGDQFLFRYSSQQKYALDAGFDSSTVLMGLPGWKSEWGQAGTTGIGSSPLAHIAEVSQLNTGVAVWDLYLNDSAWADSATLAALRLVAQDEKVVPIQTLPSRDPQSDAPFWGQHQIVFPTKMQGRQGRLINAQGNLLWSGITPESLTLEQPRQRLWWVSPKATAPISFEK
jgi:hypothetical protein